MYTDLTLRILERMLAVVIGGMAIYLGYRLFLNVPEHRDSQGKVTLPWNTTVILSRVGPGVFFALFGAVVVGLSFVKPIDYSLTYTEQHMAQKWAGAGGTLHSQVTAAIEEDRAEIQKEMAILNTLPKYLKSDLLEENRMLLELAIPRIKFKLMRAVWLEDWGNPDKFKNWITTIPLESPPSSLVQAVKIFRYPQGGTGE
jgi:hypothetical protein